MIKWYTWCLFAIVTLVALSMTWYSMMDLATGQLSLPVLLAFGVSLAFDGGAIFLGLLSIEYAKTADSGLLAEIGTYAFIATSVYIVVQHAILVGYGTVGQVMFGAAPVIVGIMLRVLLSFITRQARKDAGRVVERLPVAGKLTWLRYPGASYRLLSLAMQTRLIHAADRLDKKEDRHGILKPPVRRLAKPPQDNAKTRTDNVLGQGSDKIKERKQLSDRLETKQLTSGDNLSLPVWLPHEPTMTIATLIRTCLDNSVTDIETIYRYAQALKGQDVNKQSLARTLHRERK